MSMTLLYWATMAIMHLVGALDYWYLLFPTAVKSLFIVSQLFSKKLTEIKATLSHL